MNTLLALVYVAAFLALAWVAAELIVYLIFVHRNDPSLLEERDPVIGTDQVTQAERDVWMQRP